jgi:hypothetical protein
MTLATQAHAGRTGCTATIVTQTRQSTLGLVRFSFPFYSSTTKISLCFIFYSKHASNHFADRISKRSLAVEWLVGIDFVR